MVDTFCTKNWLLFTYFPENGVLFIPSEIILILAFLKFRQVGDMAELGISEAFKVKQAVLLSATEAAEMILRVDEIITCAPRRREDHM